MSHLTPIQKDICNLDGQLVVRACPGSGKTYTVAAKMAQLLKTWPYNYQGVATLSFTNVAWQEIEKKLKEKFLINIPIKHPHFLGTIDSFINNNIFFPYGHLVLNCDSRPVLAGEPAYSWKIKRFDMDYKQYFDKTSYNIEGDIIPIVQNKFFFGSLKKYNDNGSVNGHYKNLEKMKKRFLKKGYANQSDADYFSMRILEDFPSIARLISLRFPFIIIDEAQDTSEIQMRILDLLVENGLKDLILVGDPDQAIFEWNNAKPELFNEKFDEWENITMDESWRSSKNICQFTFMLSDLEKPAKPVNDEVCDFKHIPQILPHNNVDYCQELIDPFLEICEREDIALNSTNVAVLARSKSLIKEIIFSRNQENTNSSRTYDSDIWIQENFIKELAYSKYLYDKQEFQKSFKLLEKTYVIILKNSPNYSDYQLAEIIEKIGYFKFKERIFDLIKLMPKTDISIGDWIDNFQTNLSLNDNFPAIDMRINNNSRDLTFDDLFSYDVDENVYPYNLSTIHKVKGETFEAVMLILKKKATGSHYVTLLNDRKRTVDDEELRNVYVGITRPSKVLVLAVPSEDVEIWIDYFSDKSSKLSRQSSLSDFF